MAKTETKKAQDLLARVRRRYKAMADADRENRQNALNDLEFVHVPGKQWEESLKVERGNERPTYEFNKLRVTVKRIVNDMRANRPQGKVRAVEDGDRDTAEIMEGLCRNIWNVSDGDTTIDYAAEYQVAGGMGAWRINTRYSHDTAFDQEIYVEPIKNPFCLYADPAAQDPLKRDAMDWILTSKISTEAFKARWPKAEPCEFDSNEFDDDDDWQNEEATRIVEYWWKEPVTRTVVLLSNGVTAYEEDVAKQAAALKAAQVSVLKSREAKCYVIKSAICSGDAILEGPSDWAGAQFPFVMIYGEHVVVDGKIYWFGLTRFAKDAQRNYNYVRTAIMETIARAPQAKFWATPAQAEGNTEKWADAHKKLYPFMLYNPDPQAPGVPQHMGGADVPVALVQESQFASEDIKAVTGIFDNSLGQQGNETSGRAIAARQRQGEIATFNYSDNLAKGIRRTWEILVDLIPKIYDTERSVRILGVDGAEKYAKVNTIDPQTGEALNDITRGKFDVAVTVGPSFSTQRQEAAEAYTALGQANPMVWQAAGDLVFKAMDLPYADQIAERLKLLLPPPIQQMLQEDGGQTLPPEVVAKLAQAEQLMQQVQQQGMLVQQAAQELEGEKSKVEAAKGDLDLKSAKMEADYQRMIADITKRESAAGVSKEQDGVANDRAQLSVQVAEAVAQMQQQAAEFITQAAQIIAEIQARSQPQVIVQDPPKRKQITMQIGNRPVTAIIEETI